MSSVPLKALKTNSLSAFDLFELVVAWLSKIVGFAQPPGLSLPTCSLSLAKKVGQTEPLFYLLFFVPCFDMPTQSPLGMSAAASVGEWENLGVIGPGKYPRY